MLCRPTIIEKPRILLATPFLEPVIDLLGLPVFSLIIPCNWKDRGEHYLCSLSLNESLKV